MKQRGERGCKAGDKPGPAAGGAGANGWPRQEKTSRTGWKPPWDRSRGSTLRTGESPVGGGERSPV